MNELDAAREAAALSKAELARAINSPSSVYVYRPLYPMSFSVPPEGVGPVPVREVLPLLVIDTLDASRKPVSVPPLTVKLACPYGAKASPVNVPEPLLTTLIPPAVA